MNNEPVAWAMFKGDTFMDAIHPDEHARFEGGYNIPLYTHPVKEPMMVLDGNRVYPAVKELTYADGIEECAQRAESYAYMSPNFTALAEELRAILRKAQEK